MKAFDTYIFDLDGTLLDTLNDLTVSTNYALETYGLPTHSKEEIRSFVGNGVQRLIERAVPSDASTSLTKQVLAAFKQYYLEHSLDTTKPYPGVEDLLKTLKANGKHVAIVSNKFDTATKALANHFFPSTVDVAVGELEAEGIRKKPAPDTVEKALRLLGVRKEGAVYVGDSDVDVLAARNSGLPCISVLWGFRDEESLRQSGATTFVSSPNEIWTLSNSSY